MGLHGLEEVEDDGELGVMLTKLADNHSFWEDETCNQRVTTVFVEQPHLHTAGCITGKNVWHVLWYWNLGKAWELRPVHQVSAMVLVIYYIGLKYTGLCFERVNISIVVITFINLLIFYAFVLSIAHVWAVYMQYYNNNISLLPTQFLIGQRPAAPSSDRLYVKFQTGRNIGAQTFCNSGGK